MKTKTTTTSQTTTTTTDCSHGKEGVEGGQLHFYGSFFYSGSCLYWYRDSKVIKRAKMKKKALGVTMG